MIGKNLLTELVKEGYKFIEDDIVFITRDKANKLIWLERGNKNAGLEHIIANHKNNFSDAFGIKENEIALYLYNVITNGNIVGSKPSKILGGIDSIYECDGNYYTFVGMGGNGFIVTSFPTQK